MLFLLVLAKWDNLSFKDVMSLIPTSVSVISYLEKNVVYGCTISSVVSVNIDEKFPEIIFVLQKQSLIGEKIKSFNFFTLNVLSSEQKNLAEKYSNKREPELPSQHIWKSIGELTYLQHARVVLQCKLIKVYDSHAANIFVASVVQRSDNSNLRPLIYDQRVYGSFKTI